MKKLAFLGFMFFFIFSCHDEQAPLEIVKEIEVDEVKAFFDANINNQSKSRSEEEMEIIWERAQYLDISIGQSIIFPLEDERLVFYGDSSEINYVPSAIANYALAYKVEDSIHIELVRAIPTEKSDGLTGA